MTDKDVILVRDVMQSNFDVVEGKETVSDALKSMRFPETGMLIVNKRSSGDEYGLVVMSDISNKIITKDRSPNRVNIYEVMTKPVLSVKASMDIRYCARLFKQFKISKAPVYSGDEVVGIVSNTDMVMKALSRD